MGISRRTFLKGLGSGLTALGLSDVILLRSGWAGAVKPAKIIEATATTSICPYCGVGCGLVAYTKNGKLVDVEGDPDHPINQGSLCSKGQAVFEVVTSPRRLQKVRYRAPGSDHWEEKDLDWAVQTLAQRVKATRDASFTAKSGAGDGEPHRGPGLHRRGRPEQRRVLSPGQIVPGPGHRLSGTPGPPLTLLHGGLVGAHLWPGCHDQSLERSGQQ